MRYSGFAIEQVRSQSPGLLIVAGWVTTTTGGTIDTTKTNIPGGGASIVKTAAKTGRYTITVAPPAGESATVLANLVFMGGGATLVGPPDVALTAGKGTKAIFRQDDISQTSPSGTSAKDGTIELQWTRNNGTTDDNDTEVQDGATFYFWLLLGSPQVT